MTMRDDNTTPHNDPPSKLDAPPSSAPPQAGSPSAAEEPAGCGWRPGMPDRRVIPDRRDFRSPTTGTLHDAGRPVAETDTGLERRRGPGRRRSDFMRSAEEGEMTQEQFLFLMAIDAFKRVNGKTFPTWTDVLEIVRQLGYRKVQASDLNLPQAEDWTERADAPASVRWSETGSTGTGSGSGSDSDSGRDSGSGSDSSGSRSTSPADRPATVGPGFDDDDDDHDDTIDLATGNDADECADDLLADDLDDIDISDAPGAFKSDLPRRPRPRRRAA
ncbi:MAG: hypothetical protein ACOC0P_04640 [Planctomycetota bacterium]